MNASGMSHRSESSVRKSVRTALPGEKRGRETAGIGAFAAADALESGRSESDGVLAAPEAVCAASAATVPEAASDWVFAVPDVERAALLLVALTGRPPSNG